MARKRAPGAGRKPAGPISGKLSNFSTRITPETRLALELAANESHQSISQVAEKMIRLGLNTQAERQQSNPTQGLAVLISNLVENCEVRLGEKVFRWNTDSFVFDSVAYVLRLLLERLRPSDSALPQYLRKGKDVDELDREMLATPETWAKHIFKGFWRAATNETTYSGDSEELGASGEAPAPDISSATATYYAPIDNPDVIRGLFKMMRRSHNLQRAYRDLNLKTRQPEGKGQ